MAFGEVNVKGMLFLACAVVMVSKRASAVEVPDSSVSIGDFHWPLNNITNAKLNETALNKIAVAYGNVEDEDGYVTLSDSKAHIYVEQDFAAQCITNPNFCPHGLTVAFWVRFPDALPSADSVNYIITSGAEVYNSTGFVLYRSNDLYVVTIRGSDLLWNVSATFSTSAWSQVAFTWKISSGVKLYKDGTLQASSNNKIGVDGVQGQDSRLYIGVSGSVPSAGAPSLSIHSLTIWHQELELDTINKYMSSAQVAFGPDPSGLSPSWSSNYYNSETPTIGTGPARSVQDPQTFGVYYYVNFTYSQPISLSIPISLGELGAWTLCWFQRISLPKDEQNILLMSAGNGVTITFSMKTSLLISFTSERDNEKKTLDDLTSDSWNHICLLRDVDSTFTVYLDGTRQDISLKKSESYVLVPTITLLLSDGSAGNRFMGDLTRLNMWNHVLTADQIKALGSCSLVEGNVIRWSEVLDSALRDRANELWSSYQCTQDYWFLEASNGNDPYVSKPFRLVSGEIPPHVDCLHFDYSMEGSDMGRLKVRLEQQDGARSLLWSITGSQASGWHAESLRIANITGSKLVFEGIPGGVKSDMAIDRIILSKDSKCPLSTYSGIKGIRSNILDHHPTRKIELQSLIAKATGTSEFWEPCFSLSREGWPSVESIYTKCADKGPILLLVRYNQDYVVGGFYDKSMKGYGRCNSSMTSDKAFLFSLNSHLGTTQKVLPIYDKTKAIICEDVNNFPRFGSDLMVNFETNRLALHFGQIYKGEDIQYGQSEQMFRPDDVEILINSEAFCADCPSGMECNSLKGRCECENSRFFQKCSQGQGIDYFTGTAVDVYPLDQPTDIVNFKRFAWGSASGVKQVKKAVRGGGLSTPGGSFLTLNTSECLGNPESCKKGMTIAFWLRYNRTQSAIRPVLLCAGTCSEGSQGIKIYLKNPEEMVLQVVTNSKTLYRQSIEFGVGVWTHLVITIDPSTGNIVYVNGRVQFGNIEEFEGVYTLQDEAANVTLGGSAQADFDDFLVYESVLSPEDTAHLYAFYSGRNVSRLKIKIEIAYTYGQWGLPENDGLPKISEQQLAEFGVTQDKINALYGGENGVQGNPPKVLDTNVMSSPGNENTLVALMLEFSPAGYEAARGFIHHIETNKTLNSLYDILNVISIAFDNVYYKPVSILSVTASGNSANISWTAFHDTAHNGLYQGFKIELYNGSAVVLDHRSAEWSTNVTGLRPLTNYTARVAPFTMEGVGNWSETVSFTTPDLPPEVAPDGLTAHALSPSAVRVSWNRLESVAFNVLAYWVVYSETGRAGSLLTDIKIIAGASSNTIDIGNLKASTSYSIGVQAVSTFPGPASDPVNVTTLDGAPSAGPPTSAHVVNGTALRVEWGEIPEASRNGRITGYDIACKENISSTIVVSERVHANRTSVVIDGLDYDTVYKVTVSGRTSGGPGNATLVLARTQYGVPSIAPRNVTVVDTNSTAIRLSWDSLTRKEARGPPVGYYIALLSLNNSHVEEFTVMLSSACGSTVVVQDLRPVTMYLIQVAGFTIQGAGPLANLNVTTAEAEPTLSPNITLISASPYGITIGWTPLPVHVLQGYVRAYIVEYSGTGANVSNGSAHASASATRITLLGLRFKSLYSIRMKVLTIIEAPFSNTLMANTTEAAPPVCPPNVGTEYITETKVNITWQSIPQEEAGGVILGHMLTYVIANSSDSHRTIQVNGSQMFYLLDGLRKYTSYLVTLAAFTSTGKGKNCSLIVKTAEGKPAADVNVTISSVNTSAIVIALGEVEGNVNGALRGYVLTLYDTLRNVNITVYTCAGSGDLSLNDLFPYTPYKVLVGVFNNDNLGNSSEAASFRTLEAAPSKPPRNVTAKNSSSTTLTLTWSPPDEFYLNGILQGYRVFWQKTFESNPVVHNMTVPTSQAEDQVSTRRRRRAVTPCCGQMTLVLDGLQPYTMYTIRILAFTVADGEFVAINATTNEDVPSSPPLNVTLTANDTSINVTWQPIPEQNTNGDLLGYHVFYQESHTGNSTPRLVTVDRSSLAVQLLNLTPYTGYLVSVAGFTAPGTGEVSTMMSINTSEIRPGAAPTSIGGSGISTSSVSVTWQPVPLNKQFGRILGYKILLWNVTFQMNVSLVGEDVLSHVVSGLYTLTSYNVSLLAYNRMGEGPWSESIVLTTLNKCKPSTVFILYNPFVVL
ncbi:uncharacterized protein LOC116604334 [Nematostella vectensis]|uniref:uncharacterized protein LOC116604334 n=1 Tax=Nematostella vectensis TaxID=45351 RepID=UPI00207723B2|nr:uncharacterized protein LOC116604334 [Nematostella vectensis]